MPATSNGAWQGDNPIDFALPLLIIQICIVLVLTRAVGFILKPLRQPRVIGEIIGGILLGPSVFGRNEQFLHKLFPKPSILILDTVAGLGLLFFLFLVGLELDLRAVRKTGKNALSIAAAGICLPFAAGVGVSVVLHNTIATGVKFAPFLVFMGVAMSITAFPVLARILAELKLLTTEVGQLAMSAAAVNDVVAWILLALAVALSGNAGSGTHRSPSVVAWVLLSSVAFVIFMFVVVKPLMAWVVRRTPDNEPVREITVALTLAGVLVAGFCTDLIGIHSIFGGFLFGLIIPKDGPFAGILIEKLEDLIMTLFLPLYFASSGLKTNIGTVKGSQSGGLLVLVIVVACGGKIIGTVVVSLLHKVGFRKALTLGALMNTKGLVELIVLNIGKDRGVLNDEVFAIMVIMALVTTFMTTPIVMLIYKPARNPVPYKRRKLDMEARKEDFRVLTCVQGMKNVPAMINLAEATRGVSKHALRLYILHLMEMSERSSAIRLVQRVRRDGRPFWNNRAGADGSDHIVVAFEAYAQLSKVAVRPMTCISNFSDMHEDICGTAEEKRASIIVLPFHKHQRLDGGLETGNPGFRSVNQKVLQHAPCSVAIIVDRGLGGMAQRPSSTVDHSAVVLFFGGQDDREALALGSRMVEHPGVKLKVIRFVAGNQTTEHRVDIPKEELLKDSRNVTSRSSGGIFAIGTSDSYFVVATGIDAKQQNDLDEEALNRARQECGQLKAADGTPAVVFEEQVTSDPVSAALQVGQTGEFDLMIVGRGRKPAALIANLANSPAEHAELGLIGDALTSSSGPQVRASVVVIQQFDSELATPFKGETMRITDVNTPEASPA